MRTLVDLGEKQAKALDQLAKKKKVSRASLIREAIDSYLEKRDRTSETDAFGLWGNRKVDGLVYQEELRREW